MDQIILLNKAVKNRSYGNHGWKSYATYIKSDGERKTSHASAHGGGYDKHSAAMLDTLSELGFDVSGLCDIRSFADKYDFIVNTADDYNQKRSTCTNESIVLTKQ